MDRSRTRTVTILSALFLAMACGGSEGTGPDSPAAVSVTGGSGQGGAIGTPLPEPVVVRVTNAASDPVVGATVVFSASNGGSASPSQIVTDASGVAQTVWTLGSAISDQTLTAIAGGVQTEVTAEAFDGCDSQAWPEFEVGQTITGALSSLSCDLGGGFRGNIYTLDVSADAAVTIQMTSADDAFLFFGPAGDLATVYAFDDDGLGLLNAEMRILMPAGNYLVYASHLPGTSLGSYELDSFVGGGDSNLCPGNLWIVAPITTNQQLVESDCEFDDGSRHDLFSIALNAGQTVTATQTSTAFDPRMRLFDGTGGLVETDDDGGGGTAAQIVHASPEIDFPFLGPGSESADGRGAYTFSVTVTGGAAARVAGAGVRLPTHLVPQKGGR